MVVAGDRLSRWIVRASVVGLVLVLCFLAGFSVITQRGVATQAQRVDGADAVSRLYQDARFWAGQQESLERKYRLERGRVVLALHDMAERSLIADVQRLGRLDRSAANQAMVSELLALEARYMRASDGMFAAVDANRPASVVHFDHVIVDPVIVVMEGIVDQNATAASRQSVAELDSLDRVDTAATRAVVIAFGVGIALVLSLALVLVLVRRRLNIAMLAQLQGLAEVAITDPLTGLRNHRAFHEDLTQELHRIGRTDIPTALVMLDADDLKATNDNLGHQAGDDRLKQIAREITRTGRATDRGYRIGGDEFAVILHDAGEWAAFEYAQRLLAALTASDEGQAAQATAGIAQALSLRDKDDLIREADLALINAKRLDQDVVIYTPEMKPFHESMSEGETDGQNRKLAKALAQAVDCKDSYTQSHSQTVATLCAVIAAQLGLEDARLRPMRLAGLLHDVGKIGIPDSILKKPAKLTPQEFEEMKTHPIVGESIVLAAEMPAEAHWIRHHHERIDGHGYPDGLVGDDIPLESRIIHVADAFEAMTSNRPYRDAPGKDFAIQELQRHAGTQFDAEVVDALLHVLATPLPGRSTRRGSTRLTALSGLRGHRHPQIAS